MLKWFKLYIYIYILSVSQFINLNWSAKKFFVFLFYVDLSTKERNFGNRLVFYMYVWVGIIVCFSNLAMKKHEAGLRQRMQLCLDILNSDQISRH
jgi:hypothetical protein